MMRDLPDAYRPALSDDVPEGRACGNCVFYNEQIVDGDMAFCDLWEEYVRGDYYCDRWQSADDARSEVRQVDLDVPVYIRDAASRGLELRAEGYGGDGLTDGTIREARDMADGQITEDKVVRANAWAARHAVDLDAPSNTNTDDDGWPGNGAVAHYLWGIDPLDPEPARNWFERKAAEIQEERTMGTATITRSKEDQVRQLAFNVAPNEDGLTLDGYGAVFNEWTMIEDEYGQYRERIMPGAFRRTLGQRMPVLQFDHGTHPLIGSIPLGRITQITEDDHGLRVKARLSDNWLVQPVRDAIRDGGITGMSFRFRIVNEKWGRGSDGMEERSISEVALYEVGPVVFPAYEQTSVGVRSRHVLRALEDAEIRDEIARIMASGTDITSLATDIDDDPDLVHSSDEPSTVGHGSIPTRTQRIARMRLAGIIKE
jgi:HK97 family phage prohead protease